MITTLKELRAEIICASHGWDVSYMRKKVDSLIEKSKLEERQRIGDSLEIRQVDPANFFTSVPILFSKNLGKDVDNNYQLKQALQMKESNVNK